MATDEANFSKISPIVGRHKRGQSCGLNCPERLGSTTCPFFERDIPCLVGCTLKLVERGGTEHGLDYEEHAFFVVQQSGKYLIGEEQIISLDSPRFSRIRIMLDKNGEEVVASGGSIGMSLLEFGEFEFDGDIGDE